MPVLGQTNNSDQESTDLWRNVQCLLQTFEQTHLFHLLTQFRFSLLQLVVSIQTHSCQIGYEIAECMFRSRRISVVYPLLQMKMQTEELSLSDEAKSWCLMMLKALLPVFSNVSTVRFINYELQLLEPPFFVLWYLR